MPFRSALKTVRYFVFEKDEKFVSLDIEVCGKAPGRSQETLETSATSLYFTRCIIAIGDFALLNGFKTLYASTNKTKPSPHAPMDSAENELCGGDEHRTAKRPEQHKGKAVARAICLAITIGKLLDEKKQSKSKVVRNAYPSTFTDLIIGENIAVKDDNFVRLAARGRMKIAMTL